MSSRKRFALATASAAALFSAGPAAAQIDVITLLPDTVVSASREPLPAARVGSAITVIPGNDLETRQTRHAGDVLREVPGVAVGRTGSFGGITDVRIRGAEARHTLVLIDGIEVNDPSLGSSYDFSQLTPYNIERIEILRGPQSSIYGSDAVGGVVNIITRRAAPGIAAEAFGEGGSFGSFAGGLALRYGDPWVNGSIAFNRLQTEGTSHADRRLGNTERDALRIDNGHGKLAFTPFPFLEFNLAGRTSTSRGALDGFNFIPAIGFFGAVDDKSRYVFEQAYGRADVKLKLFDGQWVTRAGIAASRTQNDFIDDPGRLMNVNRARRRKIDVQSTVTADTALWLPIEHRFTFLFEHEREDLLSQGFDPFFPTFLKNAVSTRSYVGEYALAAADRVFVTGSYRFDDNTMFPDTDTYRITGAYLHKETATRLHGSYGNGVKNPTLFQLFGLFASFVGNPNLRPERSTGWDVGVEQKFWGRAVVDVTYFENRITDLIQSSLLTATNLPGASRARGVEIAARWRVIPELLLGGSYTYTVAQDANDSELVRRAKHIGSVFATLELFDRRARLHVDARLNGPQRDFAFDPFFNVQRVRLAGFALINVAGSFKLNEHVEVFGRIENLLDAKYQQVFTFGSPGLAAFAGLRVRFDVTP